MNKKKKCIVCGNEYDYCPRCAAYASLPTWKNEFDKEDCKNLYYLINKYVFKHIDANEANDEIEKLNVNVSNNEIKQVIDEIKANVQKENKEVVVEETEVSRNSNEDKFRKKKKGFVANKMNED